MEIEQMSTVVQNPAERVGPAFSVDGMLLARQKTRQAIKDISVLVQPGMVEEDAVEMARKVLVDSGMQLSWHPTRVRFGSNTMKPMKVASVPGVVLQENDIFFLDIAPRIEHWEGDAGKSFVVGHNPEYKRCADDAERLFHEVREAWTRERLTGHNLYAFADKTARSMGWELNFDLPGHRVSDFPHAAIYTGSLADFDASPASMRWILEIHVRDPQGRFGAFYEDMLLGDEYYD
jgi:methionyl aminopeptidase